MVDRVRSREQLPGRLPVSGANLGPVAVAWLALPFWHPIGPHRWCAAAPYASGGVDFIELYKRM